MAVRILRSPDDIPRLAAFLGEREKYPITVTITQGASRRAAQNRLSHMWYAEIAAQLGDTDREEVRADCKVTFGVPIMRLAPDFCDAWDASIGALPYAGQRSAVKNMDVPITRIMTVAQMGEYLDRMQRHWTERGFLLTDPEAMKYMEEFT